MIISMCGRCTVQRRYYEAYDDRYRQIHSRSLQWFHDEPSPVVKETILKYSITKVHSILEIGCGEGRDAAPLLDEGYRLTATDISTEAVRYCRERWPRYADNFRILDCIRDTHDAAYDFIYAIAVLHMLVLDPDREAFYRYYYDHLNDNGIGLICTMGDGSMERCTDIGNAFELQQRVHEQSGKTVHIASTSCRIVSQKTFRDELVHSGLHPLEMGITAVEPDFPQMMYAVVRKGGC